MLVVRPLAGAVEDDPRDEAVSQVGWRADVDAILEAADRVAWVEPVRTQPLTGRVARQHPNAEELPGLVVADKKGPFLRHWENRRPPSKRRRAGESAEVALREMLLRSRNR